MIKDKIINEKLYKAVAEELGLEYSQVKDVIICQFAYVKDFIEKDTKNSVILPRIGKISYNEARDKKLNEISKQYEDGNE